MNGNMMSKTIVKYLLPLLMLSVAIPESEAKRMGGGRSAGRQAQGVRKATPPAVRPAQPSQRTQQAQTPPPAAARQPSPDDRIARPQSNPQAPSAPPPSQSLPRQAASPWGGMLGGALLGLGLGSLMSRDGNAANQQNPQNQQSDSSGSGSRSGDAASGASGDYANAPATAPAATAANQQTAGTLGSLLPIGVLALIIYFAVRRMRRRNR